MAAVLTGKQRLALAAWLKDHSGWIVGDRPTIVALVSTAQSAVDFDITEHNIRSVLSDLGIEWKPKRAVADKPVAGPSVEERLARLEAAVFGPPLCFRPSDPDFDADVGQQDDSNTKENVCPN